MIIGSIKENLASEKRVSLTPESAKNIISLGLKVIIEKNYAEHLGLKDDEYKKNGQEIVFDFGFRYMGMGHIEIISCNLEDYSIFFHPGGGSNGWDRESNFHDIVKHGPKKYEDNKKNFNDWFYNINLEGQEFT